MAAGLKEICTIQVDLAEQAQEVGAGPLGHRRILEIAGGTVRGERLQGVVLPGGADWMLLGPDGWGRLDVRMQLQMDDEALIYASAQGVVELNERVLVAMAAGEETGFEDQYYRSAMRLEAGDERYAWVNRAVFVTEGRIAPKETGRGVEARLSMVT